MNHADWQTKFADRRKTTDVHPSAVFFDPTKAPDITAKLLELDEKQLDVLTGKRN